MGSRGLWPELQTSEWPTSSKSGLESLPNSSRTWHSAASLHPGYTAARVQISWPCQVPSKISAGQSTRPTELAATRDAAVEIFRLRVIHRDANAHRQLLDSRALAFAQLRQWDGFSVEIPFSFIDLMETGMRLTALALILAIGLPRPRRGHRRRAITTALTTGSVISD